MDRRSLVLHMQYRLDAVKHRLERHAEGVAETPEQVVKILAYVTQD